MQVVTLTLFRFPTRVGRLWAFAQMGLKHPAIRRMNGLSFYKLMGTGAGAGFSPKPDFTTYTLLCVWDDMTSARRALRDGRVYSAYRRHVRQMVTIYLSATRTRGQWAGQTPFIVDPATRPGGPIVALTRATLKITKLVPFWSLTPAISRAVEAQPHQHFMMGMGEIPYKHQMTFSIWDDEAAMRRFSLESPSHGVAVRRAWDEGWFAEYLFARFNLIDVDGQWPGLERYTDASAPLTATRSVREVAEQ